MLLTDCDDIVQLSIHHCITMSFPYALYAPSMDLYHAVHYIFVGDKDMNIWIDAHSRGCYIWKVSRWSRVTSLPSPHSASSAPSALARRPSLLSTLPASSLLDASSLPLASADLTGQDSKTRTIASRFLKLEPTTCNPLLTIPTN